jgi:ubiquinone/menaquinone biosynthesis C-methylase UbiE
MPWLMASVYDRVMAGAEDACLRTWRAQLLAGLSGRVLEVGPGTGASLPLYPAAVTELILAEPDPHMRERLADRLGFGPAGARVIADPIEGLALADASVDAVVASLVLCSVHSPAAALAELRRVLRPGGELVFLEHVAAEPHTRRLRWQQRVEPVWKQVAGNCHLTRDTEAAIREAGFEIVEIERDSLRKAFPLTRPSIRGRARKP